MVDDPRYDYRSFQQLSDTIAPVTLAGTGRGLILTVKDEGRGFDPAAIEGKKGLGLISMKERVSRLAAL